MTNSLTNRATEGDLPLITLAEAASRAGCSPFTVLHWVKRGKLRSYRRAGTRGGLYDPAEIDRLLIPLDSKAMQLPPRGSLMTAWLRLNMNLARHPRVVHFRRILGLNLDAAVGKVVMLILAVAEAHPSGELSAIDQGVLAEWAQFDGDLQLWATALEALTVDGKIFDWDECHDRRVEELKREADRKRRKREEEKERRQSSGNCPADGGRTVEENPPPSCGNGDGDGNGTKQLLPPLPAGIAEADVAPLLARVESVGAEPRAWIDCLGTATSDGATASQLRTAISDYLGHGGSASPSLKHFRAFIASAMKPASTRAPRSTTPRETPARPSKLSIA